MKIKNTLASGFETCISARTGPAQAPYLETECGILIYIKFNLITLDKTVNLIPYMS